MSNNLVSVIIPTYKRAGMLGRALKSLQNQSHEELEIIVVDDNPPDSPERRDTREFMNGFLKDPRIRYIERKENGGGALARNTGIQASEGDFICFLDDDDEFLPDKIEKQLSLFRESPCSKLGIVNCGISYVDGEGQAIYERCTRVRGDGLAYHLKGTLGPTGSFLFSRQAVLDAGMFSNLPASQEYILLYKIIKNGYEIDYVDEALFRMYLHEADRISTGGSRKIEGKLQAFSIVEEDLKTLLTPKEKRKAYYDHHYDLFFLYLRQKSWKSWLHHLAAAVAVSPLNKRTPLMLMALIVGFDRFYIMKMKTKKAVN